MLNGLLIQMDVGETATKEVKKKSVRAYLGNDNPNLEQIDDEIEQMEVDNNTENALNGNIS